MHPPQLGEPQQIRVAVAEHKAMLREGVCQLLQSERDFAVAATAEDGPAALSITRECRPDVLLLECDLPKMPGLRVLELLDTTATRVLLFGASIPPDAAIEALELGARGALQHDQSAALLFKSIRTVAKGEYWVDRALVGKLARQVQFATTPFRLTARQRQVVSLLVAGYSNKEIAERFKLSSNTVKHHLTSIFDKTGASTRVELAVFALHHGIAGSDPDHADTTGIEGIPRPRMARVQTPRLARDSRKQPA